MVAHVGEAQQGVLGQGLEPDGGHQGHKNSPAQEEQEGPGIGKAQPLIRPGQPFVRLHHPWIAQHGHERHDRSHAHHVEKCHAQDHDQQ